MEVKLWCIPTYLTVLRGVGLVAGTLKGQGSLRTVAMCRSLKAAEKFIVDRQSVVCHIFFLSTYIFQLTLPNELTAKVQVISQVREQHHKVLHGCVFSWDIHKSAMHGFINFVGLGETTHQFVTGPRGLGIRMFSQEIKVSEVPSMTQKACKWWCQKY